LEKRSKAYKVKAKTEFEKLLAVLGSKTYLVYVPTRNTIIKMPFIKLYEFKNSLILKGVSKLIRIRPLNDIAIIKDSTGEGVSLDLSKIDDIGSSKSIIFEVPRPSKLPVPGPFRPLELENKLLKPMFSPPEKFIKSMDSSDPDKMQLDLVISLCY